MRNRLPRTLVVAMTTSLACSAPGDSGSPSMELDHIDSGVHPPRDPIGLCELVQKSDGVGYFEVTSLRVVDEASAPGERRSLHR